MTTPLPPLPTYGSGGTTGLPSSTGKYDPNDIWKLGDLYNQPIYLGYTPGAPAATGPIASHLPVEDRVGSAGTNTYGKTQSLIDHYNELWQKGTAGDKKSYTDFVNLQKQLWYAGAYGQTSFDSVHVGQWTDQTLNALENALSGYVQTSKASKKPQTFEDWLQANAAGGLAAGGGFDYKNGPGGSGASAPSPTQLTDPNALRQTVQQAAQAALGRGLSDAELSKFVDAFHQSETSAQQTAQGSGGTVTPPDQQSDALAYAEQSDPQQYANHQAQGYFNAFMNLFLPSGSSRANIQPVASI